MDAPALFQPDGGKGPEGTDEDPDEDCQGQKDRGRELCRKDGEGCRPECSQAHLPFTADVEEIRLVGGGNGQSVEKKGGSSC